MKFKVEKVRIVFDSSEQKNNSITLNTVLEGPFESPNEGTGNVASMSGIGEGMTCLLRVEPTLPEYSERDLFRISVLAKGEGAAASGVWKRSSQNYGKLLQDIKEAKSLEASFGLVFEVEGDKVERHSPLSITQELRFTGIEICF